MKFSYLAIPALLWTAPAFAACPAGQQEMLTARVYFGLTMNGRNISAAAWRDFLARTVTPRFSAGFTVYEAQGQWRDTKTHMVTREASKVVEIIGIDASEFRDGVAEIRKIYIARFHQQAVGLTMLPVCGTF